MRKHLFILILTIFILPVYSAKKPKTIDEAVAYFEKKWSKKDKELYAGLKEEQALIEMDFLVGVWIRNEWIRFAKDTTLRQSFHQMGITHVDDMSDIILTCVYRKLNLLPFDIEAQVKRCKEYWTPIRECEERAAIKATDNYDQFKIGDSITLFLYVEKLVGPNGIIIDCPENEEWGFDYKKDLIVRGLVNEKYFLYGDPFFKVQVTSLSSDQTRIFYKQVKPGDVAEFPLKFLLVKPPPRIKKVKGRF
jgi:hypothetical protein